MMSPVFTALMIPFLGTALGSGFVFFMKRDMPALLQKVLLGFASGVMVAASVWSLIIPAIEMGEGALLSGQPLKHRHHRFCPRLRPDDGPGCGIRINNNEY